MDASNMSDTKPVDDSSSSATITVQSATRQINQLCLGVPCSPPKETNPSSSEQTPMSTSPDDSSRDQSISPRHSSDVTVAGCTPPSTDDQKPETPDTDAITELQPARKTPRQYYSGWSAMGTQLPKPKPGAVKNKFPDENEGEKKDWKDMSAWERRQHVESLKTPRWYWAGTSRVLD